MPPQRSHPILDALETCPAFRTLKGRLPAAEERCVVGGAHGSARTALVAALHDRTERVYVVVAASPTAAASAEADLEALLGAGEAYLYPQREHLPYESSEPHLEIGGLRVEAVEALFSGPGARSS